MEYNIVEIEKIQKIHDKAMDLAEEAFVAQARKDQKSKELFEQAYSLELEAAKKVETYKNFEPTRSILYRSAATLAKQCSQYLEAIELIQEGISVNTPPEIKEEMQLLKKEIEDYVSSNKNKQKKDDSVEMKHTIYIGSKYSFAI